MDFCRDNNDDYICKFYLDDSFIDSCYIGQNITPEGGLISTIINIPAEPSSIGFNKLLFYPTGSDPMNSIGHIILLD